MVCHLYLFPLSLNGLGGVQQTPKSERCRWHAEGVQRGSERQRCASGKFIMWSAEPVRQGRVDGRLYAGMPGDERWNIRDIYRLLVEGVVVMHLWLVGLWLPRRISLGVFVFHTPDRSNYTVLNFRRFHTSHGIPPRCCGNNWRTWYSVPGRLNTAARKRSYAE